MSNVIEFNPSRDNKEQVIARLDEIREMVESGEAVGFLSVLLKDNDETQIIGAFTKDVTRLKVRGMLHSVNELFL